MDQLLDAVTSLRTGRESDLYVAASMTIAEHLIPVWLSEMRTAHPEMHVGLEVANCEHVQELVISGNAHLGFVEGPTVDRRLTPAGWRPTDLRSWSRPDTPGWNGNAR